MVIDEVKDWIKRVNLLLDTIQMIKNTFLISFSNYNETTIRNPLGNILSIRFGKETFSVVYYLEEKKLSSLWPSNDTFEYRNFDAFIQQIYLTYPDTLKLSSICDICYEKVNSSEKSFSCPHANCRKMFHTSCIIQWARYNPTVKHYYNIIMFKHVAFAHM